MENLISIAKIINFHGIAGEVKVGYTAGRESQLKSIKEMYLEKNGELIKLTIESLRFHKKFALIKFKGINSIDEVTQIKNMVLKIPKDIVCESLQEDEYLINDLIGVAVYDQNDDYLGKIVSVADVAGADILSVESGDKKIHLIPFVKELVPAVDIKNKKMLINNIDGLIE